MSKHKDEWEADKKREKGIRERAIGLEGLLVLYSIRMDEAVKALDMEAVKLRN